MLRRRIAGALSTIAFCVSLPVCVGAQKVSWHLQERIRLTSIHNYTLGDVEQDRGFLRVRTRLGAEARLGKGLEVRFRLTNEFRDYWEPDDIEFEWDEQNELVVENLYFRCAGELWDIVVGKRGYHLGRGMVIMEGGPLDGSRTVHLHGVWVTRRRMLGTQTLMYLFAPEEERYPEPFWNDDRTMVESDEWAVAWLREWRRGHVLYLYRESQKRANRPWKGIHVLDFCVRQPSRRALVQFEGALQLGKQGNKSVLAYGGWLSFGQPQPRRRLTWEAGYIAMSGDDPSTDDCEGWDPVFSRWPMLSELYIYTLAAEEGVAYWSNLHGPYLRMGWGKNPVDLSARFYSWWAFHGEDKHRSEDLQLWAHWRVTDQVSSHLLAEFLWPGGFHPSNEGAHFLRAELSLVF